MATSDPVPRERARPQPQKAATTSCLAASAPVCAVNPRFVPLLDLIAEFIAHHIVANPAPPCHQKRDEASPSVRPSAALDGSPGIPGPFPTIPADSHERSQATPTEPRRRGRRRAQGGKEFQHESD